MVGWRVCEQVDKQGDGAVPGQQASREESEVNDLLADGVLARSVVVAAALGDGVEGAVERRQMP